MLGRRTRARDMVLLVADSELSEAPRPVSGQYGGNQASLLSSLLVSFPPAKEGVVPSHIDVALGGLCQQPGHSSSCLPFDLEARTGFFLPSLSSSHFPRVPREEGALPS